MANVDLNQLITVADTASSLRKLDEQVDRQLNIDQEKKELSKRVMDAGSLKGESLTEEQVGTAVEDYFSEFYSFKEPKKYFSADLFVNRDMIKRRVIYPALAVAAAGLVAFGAINYAKKIHMNNLERDAEQTIESVFRSEKKIQGDLASLLSSPLIQQFPEKEKISFNEFTKDSENRIKEADSFLLNNYIENGSAKEKVNQKNFKDALNQVEPIEDSLAIAYKNVEKGKDYLNSQEKSNSLRRNLESSLAEITNLKPLPVFKERADIAYNEGLIALKSWNFATAQEDVFKISKIKLDNLNYSTLVKSVEDLYNEAKTIAKEDLAIKEADRIYSEASVFVKSIEVGKLENSVKQLEYLDNTLKQDFTIRVINRQGVKSGMDRYYTDSSGKRASGFYLIVEAVDSSGNIIPRAVRNEEDGRVETVRMWGKRVPTEVYESIKADKIDNGIIENDTVGKKPRGYITETITMKGVDSAAGCITQW